MFRKFVQVLLAFGVAVFLCHCQSVGTENLGDVNNYVGLVQGKTTKLEVYDRLGQPADVTYDGEVAASPSTWIFFKADVYPNAWSFVPYIGVLAGGSNEQNMKAVFKFDAKEKFLSIKTETDTSYTNGLMAITRDTYRRVNDPKYYRVEAEMKRLGKPFDTDFADWLGERRWSE